MTKPALSGEHPIAMAHRGSQTLWPENTMIAFQGAIDLGFRYLETDIRATRDGVLVACHDPTLERTTDGSGPVVEHTFEDLQQLDAGYGFSPEHDHPQRGRGVRIPTLDELLLSFPHVILTLDLKAGGIEAPLHDLIARRKAWDRVIVGSFRDRRLRRFRTIAEGRVATSSGPAETARFLTAARTGRATRMQADALQVPARAGPIQVVTERTVRAAHESGKQVHVWTVNDRERMVELLDLGVDGIITDRPDVLRDVMQQRGSGGPWNE